MEQTKLARRKSSKFNDFESVIIYNRAIFLFNEMWTKNFVFLANKFRLSDE